MSRCIHLAGDCDNNGDGKSSYRAIDMFTGLDMHITYLIHGDLDPIFRFAERDPDSFRTGDLEGSNSRPPWSSENTICLAEMSRLLSDLENSDVLQSISSHITQRKRYARVVMCARFGSVLRWHVTSPFSIDSPWKPFSRIHKVLRQPPDFLRCGERASGP